MSYYGREPAAGRLRVEADFQERVELSLLRAALHWRYLGHTRMAEAFERDALERQARARDLEATAGDLLGNVEMPAPMED